MPGETPAEKADHSYLYRSTDDGKTWSRHATIAIGFNETGLLNLPDGTILAALRKDGGKANVHLSRSTDGGKTWGEPKPVSGESAHPADLVRLNDGRILLTTGFRPNPFGVRAVIGDDRGNFDWANRIILADDSTNVDTGYPSSIVRKDGRVLTLYYATGSKTHPDWGTHCAAAEFTPPK